VRIARIHVDFLLAIMSIMETEYTKSCLSVQDCHRTS
jgi:hypothetical protein